MSKKCIKILYALIAVIAMFFMPYLTNTANAKSVQKVSLSVNTVYYDSKKIAGTSTAYANITAKIGSKTYYGKTSGKGKFSLSVPSSKIGTKIVITSKKKGYGSKTINVTVSKKYISSLSVNAKYKKSLRINGTTLPYSSVTAKVNGKYYGCKTQKNGKFTITVPTDIHPSTILITVNKTNYITRYYNATVNYKIEPGIYKVGRDIKAGNYMIYTNKDDIGYAYYKVSKNSSFSKNSITADVLPMDNEYQSLKEGEYIKLFVSYMYPLDKARPLVSKNNMYKEGMYKVGQDIKAGEYLIKPSKGSFDAEVSVAKDCSHSFESDAGGVSTYTFAYLTITNGEYIRINNYVTLMQPIKSVPLLTSKNGVYSDGMYKVGRDIKAGKYVFINTNKDGGFYQINKDSYASYDSTIFDTWFTGKKYATLNDGQYITLLSAKMYAVDKVPDK